MTIGSLWLAALSALPAVAVESADYKSEIGELGSVSSSVIIGFIERQQIGVSETVATLRVIRSFKGPFQEGQSLPFVTRSGRVRVAPNQPDLTGVNRAVFYLAESDGPEAGKRFSAVKDNYGFKPIIHDNVYTNPQNPMETVRLKKYQAALTEALRS